MAENNSDNKNDKHGRWEKVYVSIISVMFTIIVGMVVFFAQQADKRMAANEKEIRAIQGELNKLKYDLQQDLKNSSIDLVRMEVKIDALKERLERFGK